MECRRTTRRRWEEEEEGENVASVGKSSVPLLPRHYDTFMLRPLRDVHSTSYAPCGTTHTTEGKEKKKKEIGILSP